MASCTTITSCTQLRITDTSASRRLKFNLQLFPMYGQAPTTIPFIVDISPCRTHTLSASSNPPQLVMSKHPYLYQVDYVNLSPTYNNLFISTYPSDCPVLSFEIFAENGSTNLTISYLSSISLKDGDTASIAKLAITTGQHWTFTIKIKAQTLTSNAQITLPIRVCGTETISLSSNQKRFFVNGQSAGQFFIVPESTFETWFTIGPAGDPCTIQRYELFTERQRTDNTELAEWPTSDTSLQLTGSLGSYQLKFDLTRAGNTRVMNFKAITRGLNWIYQRVEWVVCAADQSLTIRPPQTSYYAAINVGASGIAANAPFTEWNINEIYQGCGRFWKYGIIGTAGTLNMLQYPEPGKTLSTDCTTPADCLNVRVTDTSVARKLIFNLVLYPQFGQTPVSVPFVIDVTPCYAAQLSINGQVDDVILEKSTIFQNLHRIDVDQVYLPFFVSSMPAQCPIISLEALNSDSTPFTSRFVSFVNMNDGNYFLEVINDYQNIKRIQLKACIITTCKSIYFNIKVCGSEELKPIADTKRHYIIPHSNGTSVEIAAMNDTTRYYSVNQTTFSKFFVIVPAIDKCTVNFYDIVQPSISNAVSLSGSFGTNIVKIDRTVLTPTNQTVMLLARTKGRVVSYQQLSWEVCRRDALQFSSSVSSIWRVFTLKQGTNHNSIVTYGSYKDLLKVNNCTSCPVSQYRVLNYDMTPYNGSVVQLDRDFNILISTFLPFRGMPLWLEAFYNSSAECGFIASQKIKLDLEVCGTENITVTNQTDILYYHYWFSTMPNQQLNLTEMKGLFSLNSTTCKIEKWELRNFQNYSLSVSGETVWSQFIKINEPKDVIEINHNNAPAMDNNTEFTIYFTAITNGGVFNSKTLNFKFSTKQVNLLQMITQTTQQLAEIRKKKEEDAAAEIKRIEEELKIAQEIANNKNETQLPPEIPLNIEKIVQIREIESEIANITAKLNEKKNFEVAGKVYSIPQGVPPKIVVNERTEKIVDPLIVAALWTKFNEEKATTAFPNKNKDTKDVGINVGTMTRDGKLKINFNQPLIVPPFSTPTDSNAGSPYDNPGDTSTEELNNQTANTSTEYESNNGKNDQTNVNQSHNSALQTGSEERGRILVSVQELNLTRDVMNFEYIMGTKGADASDISYDVYIQSWTEEGIELKLNFTNPLAVSQGRGNDRAMVSIKNPGLFVSKNSGKMIQPENAVAVQKIPRQVSHDADAAALENQAIVASLIVKALLVLLLYFQIKMGMPLDELWLLYFTMQIMCYLKYYDSPFPANVQMYMDKFTGTVEFDLLNPQTYIRLFNPNFRFVDWFSTYDKTLMFESDMEISTFDDLQVFIFLGIGFVLIVFAFEILKKVRYDHTEWYDSKLKALKKYMIWNGSIRCISAAYIKTCITVGQQIRLFLDGFEFQGNQEKLILLVLGGYVVAVPWYAFVKIRDLRESLTYGEVRSKYLVAYDGVHLYRDKWNIFYFSFSHARKLIFVMIPSLFFAFPFIQLQMLMFGTSFYLMYYVSTRPFKDHARHKMETFNELIILIGGYHMLTFSKFNLKDDTSFQMGYSFITITALMIGVNLGYITHKTFGRWRRRNLILHKKRMEREHDEKNAGNVLKKLVAQTKEQNKQKLIDGEFSAIATANQAVGMSNSNSESLSSSSGSMDELPAYEPVTTTFEKQNTKLASKSPLKSRTVRFNLSNVTKLPMAKINEEDSEHNQTYGDIDFSKSAGMVKLPQKKKGRNNVVFATSPEERAQQELEEEEDESRNRWFEYYRGIGYTTDKLVEAGLTKKLDKIIDPKERAIVNVNDIKNQLKIGDKLKPKQIASAQKAKTVKVSELEDLDETSPKAALEPEKPQMPKIKKQSFAEFEQVQKTKEIASTLAAKVTQMQTIEYQAPRKIETMQEIISRLKKDDPNNKKQREFQHFVVKEKTEKEIAELEKKYEEARKILKDVKLDLKNKYDESLNILKDD